MLEYGVSNGRKRIQIFTLYVSPCLPVIFTTHDEMQHGDWISDLLPATFIGSRYYFAIRGGQAESDFLSILSRVMKCFIKLNLRCYKVCCITSIQSVF